MPDRLVGGYHLLVDGILQHLRFLCRHEAGAKATRRYGKQQGYTGGQRKADAERFLVRFPYSGFFQHALQGKDCQQGNGEFRYDEDG